MTRTLFDQNHHRDYEGFALSKTLFCCDHNGNDVDDNNVEVTILLMMSRMLILWPNLVFMDDYEDFALSNTLFCCNHDDEDDDDDVDDDVTIWLMMSRMLILWPNFVFEHSAGGHHVTSTGIIKLEILILVWSL